MLLFLLQSPPLLTLEPHTAQTTTQPRSPPSVHSPTEQQPPAQPLTQPYPHHKLLTRSQQVPPTTTRALQRPRPPPRRNLKTVPHKILLLNQPREPFHHPRRNLPRSSLRP